jgi:chorismate mutase
MNTGEDRLGQLRQEIDEIDAAIQDLLLRRTEIVEQVALTKKGDAVKLRPGREARILRRLVQRHRGRFPKPELVRIWREIMSAQLRLQGPFSVAVHAPEGESGYWQAARRQYGAYTPMTRHASPWRVIETVVRGDAVIGILPLPNLDDAEPWWRHLAVQTPPAGEASPPRIIARLPFVTAGTDREPEPDALVIAMMVAEESGADSTYLSLDLDRDASTRNVISALQTVGLSGAVIARWHDSHRPERWQQLLLAEGFLALDDVRLSRLAEQMEIAADRVVVLGAYAEPLGEAELAEAAAAN